MNYKLSILEDLEICGVGIITVTLMYHLNFLPIVGLGFGLVIVMRYIFEELKRIEERK